MIDPAILIGTWQLADTRAHDGEGRPIRPPYGGKGLGVISFDTTGRMVAVLCEGGEIEPGESREYSSYCGIYSFDGETLITRIDATNSPGRIASDHIRKVRFEGKTAWLISPPREIAGVMTQFELQWERVSA